MAAVELRHLAELALEQELEQRDLAVVKVRQVDARAEDAPARVLGVRGGGAAQHSDADRRVEQDEVDGDLERGGRHVVLGVEEGVVLDRDRADLAGAVDADRSEIERAGALELAALSERRRGGLRHRVHQVEAGARASEHVRDEEPLRDLEALLVLLQELALGVDRGATGEVVGEALGRGVDELGEAQLLAEAVREVVVDRFDVVAQLGRPGGSGPVLNAHARSRGRLSSTRGSLPPSERGSEPGAARLTFIEHPIVSLIRPPRCPRTSRSV